MKTYCTYILAVATLVAVTSFFNLPVWAGGYNDPPAPVTGQHTVNGTIEKIDIKGTSLTIKGAVNTKTFKVVNDAKITRADQAPVKLSDLKVGEKITVTYEERDGVLVALKIAQAGAAVKY